MNVASYENGAPYWVALHTEDLAGAARFYGALFGWQAPASSAKTAAAELFLLRGLPVAGIEARTGPGRSVWQTFVNVADADETAHVVTRAGGRVVRAPAELGTAGRLAVFADPFGAQFAVWQPGERKGAGVVDEPGAYAWSELIADDVAAAAAFYGAVFGWTLTTAAADDPLRRSEWQLRGRSIAGLLPRPPAMPKEIPPYWDVYFAVADSAATVASVTRLGGATLMPPTDLGHGRIAVFTDPAGAVFTVIAPATDSTRAADRR
jgi:predicted enzyme related to lactoylglutathione lyase